MFKGLGYAIDHLLFSFAGIFARSETQQESLRQFFTFAFIGVGNTLIDFSIYAALTRHVGIFDYHSVGKYGANVISFGIATTYSFFANRTWTFRRIHAPRAGEVIRFYTTTISGLLWNTVILFVLSGVGGINDLIAKLFATLFSMIWNFFFKKYWVFR